MASQRLRSAAKDLEHIDESTGEELEDLHEAIEEIHDLHDEHKKELKMDEKFITDLKKLFKELKMVRKIERHMQNELESYGDGELSKKEFKQYYMKDEEKFVQVVREIKHELSEMVNILSQEERLTDHDLDIEGATENLLRELNQEEKELEKTHKHLKSTLTQ